jgi:branched-chain amino acid transport system permease protein
MTVVESATRAPHDSGIDTRLPSLLTSITPRSLIAPLVVLAVALFALPLVLSAFWLQIALQGVSYSGVALGLGLLVGRTGMYSLCHIPLLASGTWISLRVAQEVDMPFPILLVVTAVLTGLVGVVIGLPALRLSGLYLALITLMAAGAMTLLLQLIKFPNGGGGFSGFDKTLASGTTVLERPSIAQGDTAFYRYAVVVTAILFLVVAWHLKGKPGRAWAAIRQSHVTAVAAGIDTTLYRLWAFALSAAVSGVAGALVAAGPGGVTVNQFPVEQSITLLAVVLMGGVYNIWGALVAGFLLRVLPQILDQKLGIPTEVLTILFGVGVMQVLLVQPKGIVEDLRGLAFLITHAHRLPSDVYPLGAADLGQVRILPRRIGALAIDGLLVAVIARIAYLTDNKVFAVCVAVIVYFLVRLLPTVAGGQSFGKKRLGIRVARQNGARPGWVQAIVRDALLIVDVATVGLAAFGRTSHQRLGDTAAGTVVVAADPQPAASTSTIGAMA